MCAHSMPGTTRQLELRFPARGGARKGAGRKPKGKVAGVPHRDRIIVHRRHPVLVTTKLLHVVGSLRTRDTFAVVRRAILARAEGLGARIVEFSVHADHSQRTSGYLPGIASAS